MYHFKTCRHIMPTGLTCKSPAMRGSAYCYYHEPQKLSRRDSRTTETEIRIERVDDPSSIPLIGNQILQALAANKLSNSRAAIMLQVLHAILASFRMASADAINNYSFDIGTELSNPSASPGASLL